MWKENEVADDEDRDEVREGPKGFLTLAQKRKIAYITGETNAAADSCTAYVVLSVGEGVEKTPKEIAELIVRYADATQFMGKTLRVDRVGASKGKTSLAEQAEEQRRKAEEDKRTVYVGNLDFAQGEDGLRQLVEELLVAERGQPPKLSGDLEGKEPRWVERVRIIRDKDTALGKGFAYVLLKVIPPPPMSSSRFVIKPKKD
jgi:nucleolar protein 12